MQIVTYVHTLSKLDVYCVIGALDFAEIKEYPASACMLNSTEGSSARAMCSMYKLYSFL